MFPPKLSEQLTHTNQQLPPWGWYLDVVGRLLCPQYHMSCTGWTSHGPGRVSHARLVTGIGARQNTSTRPSRVLGLEHMANDHVSENTSCYENSNKIF